MKIFLLSTIFVKGKKIWQQKLPFAIFCIEQMEIPSRGLSLIAVALASNHVLVYDDKNVVDCFKMDNPVAAMKFGKFGREDNTLVLVTVRENYHRRKVVLPRFGLNQSLR